MGEIIALVEDVLILKNSLDCVQTIDFVVNIWCTRCINDIKQYPLYRCVAV